MLVVISPAKKLNFEDPAPRKDFTTPGYLKESQKLISALRKCKPAEIKKMMKLSDALTDLNVDRYQKFETPFSLKNAKQAIYAFQGDTYVGFDVDTMKKSDVDYAQKHLRILSGLYGMIAPLDLIQPYRLEMGTKFSCAGKKDLYEFWKKSLISDLNKILEKEKVLVNLASKEYFSSIDSKKVEGRIVTPVFKEKKGRDYKIVGIMAKRARGMMSRYICENRIKDVEKLKEFKLDNYKFSKKDSTESEFVFLRG